MKIVVNYDFWNALKNQNEPITPFTVIRNNKDVYLFYYPLIYFGYNTTYLTPTKAASFAPIQVAMMSLAECMINNIWDKDYYKEKSTPQLQGLVNKLRAIDVETDFELIKKTTLDGRVYNLHLNEKKIPQLVESKYLLVPSYSYSGNIKDTSIVQEHVIGSDKYVLSHGSKVKKKVLKYAYNQN